MTVVLAAMIAAAPPWAATDCFTRSTPDCADADPAIVTPNASATVGTTTRNMVFSRLNDANVVGLRRPLSLWTWRSPIEPGMRPLTAGIVRQLRLPRSGDAPQCNSRQRQ